MPDGKLCDRPRHAVIPGYLCLVLVLLAAQTTLADNEYFPSKHPDWSPHGRQLAFEAIVNGVSNIYIANIADGRAQRLTNTPSMDSYPRFSSDGGEIVFLSRRYGDFSLHVATLHDANIEDLLAMEGNLEPAFSPDGTTVAFRSYRFGNAEVVLVNRDGSNPIRLTNNDVEDGFPSFSVDGQSLFFHRTIDDVNQIMRLDLETGVEVRLTDGDYHSWHPHQSPDGQLIVYDAEKGGDRNIFVMRLDTGATTQLTFAPGRDGYPKWSPDGERIAFHSARAGQPRIYLMNADGSEQRPLRIVIDD